MQLTYVLIETGFSISLLANALLFIPQIIAILRKKSSSSLSLITFLGFNVIQLFTLCHGIIVQDYLLAAGQLLSLMTCGAITVLILYFR